MCMFQENDSLEGYVDAQIRFYSERSLEPKPYVVLQGSLSNLQSYVIVEGTTYSVGNPVRAVDVCLKATKTLGCGYSHDSKLAWIYIEKFVYGIDCEEVPPAVKALRSNILHVTDTNQPNIQTLNSTFVEDILPTPCSSALQRILTQNRGNQQSTSLPGRASMTNVPHIDNRAISLPPYAAYRSSEHTYS